MLYKVAVVDDDANNIVIVRDILAESDIKVVAIHSGRDLLEYYKSHTVDIILLDVLMPEMDGFEALIELRKFEKCAGANETPVIFLTATEDPETETKGLELGAMDFIKKPFVPKVLTRRVLHSIELNILKNDLEREVKKKTKENERLFLGIVRSLAEAIDAKDTYTNGHSVRVAEYSREIARRAGYDDEFQERIYIAALLHDVGKIGVPDAIINKEGRLDDYEYEIIRSHPGKGSKILESINDMPELVVGARWHHERYDGKGYPDGLKGKDIPEAARIVAVADAYDAMSSNRSYRKSLDQSFVKKEIEKGKGSQFDPSFADIMIDMINEDTEYLLREHDTE